MEKLMKTSRVIDGFVRAFRGVCLGLAIALAILMVVAMALPQAQLDKVVDTSDVIADIGMIEVRTSGDLPLQGPVRLTVALMLLCGAAALALASWALSLLHKVLVPMRDGRPFDSGVSVLLKKLGWVTLIGGLTVELLSVAVTRLEARLFDLSQIFVPGIVTGYTVKADLDGALIAPVVILLLSHVFEYGEQLQRQSDETL